VGAGILQFFKNDLALRRQSRCWCRHDILHSLKEMIIIHKPRQGVCQLQHVDLQGNFVLITTT
jgi:hypothetical protein